MLNLVYDVGGTYIKWGLFKNNVLIQKGKFTSFTENKGKNGIAKKLISFYESMVASGNEISNIAISTTGVIDAKTSIIINADEYIIPNYINTNFKKIFAENGINILRCVENDVNCALVGEISFSKINDDSIFMIALGTGIGGSVMINHKLYYGANYFAGEVGKMLLNKTPWERLASAINFERNAQHEYHDDSLTCEKIFYSKNLNKYERIIDNWYKELSLGIGNILLNWNPNRFIIGGGVSKNPNFNIEKIVDYISEIFGTELITKTIFTKPLLYNDAALYGANSMIK